MPLHNRQFVIVLALLSLTCGLSACGTVNEKLTEGLADYVPQWAGGLPSDAPPRPGTAKYEAYMREREQKRLEPAAAKQEAGTSAPLDAVH